MVTLCNISYMLFSQSPRDSSFVVPSFGLLLLLPVTDVALFFQLFFLLSAFSSLLFIQKENMKRVHCRGRLSKAFIYLSVSLLYFHHR